MQENRESLLYVLFETCNQICCPAIPSANSCTAKFVSASSEVIALCGPQLLKLPGRWNAIGSFTISDAA